MATQAEIVARLKQSIANERELQRRIKASAPSEEGAEATVTAAEEEAR